MKIVFGMQKYFFFMNLRKKWGNLIFFLFESEEDSNYFCIFDDEIWTINKKEDLLWQTENL